MRRRVERIVRRVLLVLSRVRVICGTRCLSIVVYDRVLSTVRVVGRLLLVLIVRVRWSGKVGIRVHWVLSTVACHVNDCRLRVDRAEGEERKGREGKERGARWAVLEPTLSSHMETYSWSTEYTHASFIDYSSQSTRPLVTSCMFVD